MIMKIAIVGRDSYVVRYYKGVLKRSGFIYSHKPDVVISLGGDGTLLLSERWYPGVPKLPIRDKSICVNCDWNSLHSIIKKIKKRKFRIEKKMKLQATAKGRRMIALNEFTLRNASQIHAIRFEVEINGKKINGTLIGDGIIVSTSFGSTGYYHSLTKKKFSKGIGVAFNNLTNPVNPLIIKDHSKVKLRMMRGVALVSHDNDPHMLRLHEGDAVEIKKAKEIARIIKINK